MISLHPQFPKQEIEGFLISATPFVCGHGILHQFRVSKLCKIQE